MQKHKTIRLKSPSDPLSTLIEQRREQYQRKWVAQHVYSPTNEDIRKIMAFLKLNERFGDGV